MESVTIKTILGILGEKIDLTKIMKKNKDGKEVYDMCKAFEDYKEEGRCEGKREGEMQTLTAVIKNLMNHQKITFEAAVDMLGISQEKQKELRPLV